MTPCVRVSRGKHVSVRRIWIAYAGAGAHTCEVHSHKNVEYARGRDLGRIRNAQTSYFRSGLRRGGILCNVCYWICSKLFKFANGEELSVSKAGTCRDAFRHPNASGSRTKLRYARDVNARALHERRSVLTYICVYLARKIYYSYMNFCISMTLRNYFTCFFTTSSLNIDKLGIYEVIRVKNCEIFRKMLKRIEKYNYFSSHCLKKIFFNRIFD